MSLRDSLRQHWPEYAIEALLIAAFMVSALGFTVLPEHPASPARLALETAWLRRLLMGVAMGATAVALIYSPWGRRSGAHLNPALTLTYFRLGKIEPADALLYAASQFAGGAAGVALAAAVLGSALGDPTVRFAVTVPGAAGPLAAFLAEAAISFGLMLAVLVFSNRPRLSSYTGLCAGALVALYITIEAPLSGMSMNPARTLGSAAGASHYTGLWIYFTAPPLGMALAAQTYLGLRGPRPVRCAKLHHRGGQRCIFRCGWDPAA